MRISFPLQHWLHERASMMRYMYIVFLVIAPIAVSFDVLICPVIMIFMG